MALQRPSPIRLPACSSAEQAGQDGAVRRAELGQGDREQAGDRQRGSAGGPDDSRRHVMLGAQRGEAGLRPGPDGGYCAGG